MDSWCGWDGAWIKGEAARLEVLAERVLVLEEEVAARVDHLREGRGSVSTYREG